MDGAFGFDRAGAKRVVQATRDVEASALGGRGTRRRPPAGAADFDLSQFDFGIKKINQADSTVTINGGSVFHHPTVYMVAETTVAITSGTEEAPHCIALKYAHRGPIASAAVVIPNTVAPDTGTDQPPQDTTISRLRLYWVYLDENGKVKFPARYIGFFGQPWNLGGVFGG